MGSWHLHENGLRWYFDRIFSTLLDVLESQSDVHSRFPSEFFPFLDVLSWLWTESTVNLKKIYKLDHCFQHWKFHQKDDNELSYHRWLLEFWIVVLSSAFRLTKLREIQTFPFPVSKSEGDYSISSDVLVFSQDLVVHPSLHQILNEIDVIFHFLRNPTVSGRQTYLSPSVKCSLTIRRAALGQLDYSSNLAVSVWKCVSSFFFFFETDKFFCKSESAENLIISYTIIFFLLLVWSQSWYNNGLTVMTKRL